jgi:hypothetical protein
LILSIDFHEANVNYFLDGIGLMAKLK